MNKTIQTIYHGFSDAGLATRSAEYRFAETVESDYTNAVVTKLKGETVVIFFDTLRLAPALPEIVAAIRAGNIMKGSLPGPEATEFAFFIAEQTLKVRVIEVPLTSLPDNFDWKTAKGCLARIDRSPYGLQPFDMGELDPVPMASFLFKEDKDAIFFKMRWS